MLGLSINTGFFWGNPCVDQGANLVQTLIKLVHLGET